MKKIKVHPQTHCLVCNRRSKAVLCKVCVKRLHRFAGVEK